MHEQHKIEKKLRVEANRISKNFGGASVVVIVGGSIEPDIPRTMTASSIQGQDVRLRDLWEFCKLQFRSRAGNTSKIGNCHQTFRSSGRGKSIAPVSICVGTPRMTAFDPKRSFDCVPNARQAQLTFANIGNE
jgi:hypothetical protein